jgi:hypothetical protein
VACWVFSAASNLTPSQEINHNLEYVLVGESLIPKLDGNQLVYWQKALFKVGVSAEFKRYSSEKNKKATPETLLACYEIRSVGRYGKNLKSLPGTWSQKCVTQHQLIKFCKQSQNLLATAYDASTIFLCKLDETKPINETRPYDNLMVARVYFHGFGFHLVYSPLHFGGCISNDYFYRIVMPKI